MVRWVPLVVLVAAIVLLLEGNDPLPLVVGIHLFVLFWVALACHGELARQRPKKHGVDYAKNGAVGADAESQCQNGDGGEAGRLHQHSQCVFQIA